MWRRAARRGSGDGRSRAAKVGLHRRNRDNDQDVSRLWTSASRGTTPRARRPRSRQDNHRRRRSRARGRHRPDDAGRPRERQSVPRRCRTIAGPDAQARDIVVTDNPPAHEPVESGRAIERADAELRLPPPCGPDFNPVETACSKSKTSPRKTAAATVENLWNAGRDAIKPPVSQIFNHITNYRSTPQGLLTFIWAMAWLAAIEMNAEKLVLVLR